jgi:hypothetical protein
VDLPSGKEIIGDRYRPAIPEPAEVYRDGEIDEGECYEVEHGALGELLDKLDLFPYPLDLFPPVPFLLDAASVPVADAVEETEEGGEDREGETGKYPGVEETEHHAND